MESRCRVSEEQPSSSPHEYHDRVPEQLLRSVRLRENRMALVLLGKYKVRGPAGTYECTCVNGRYFTGIPSSTCTECLHPLNLHDEYGKNRSISFSLHNPAVKHDSDCPLVPVAPQLPGQPYSTIDDQSRLVHESTPIGRLSSISPREKTVTRLQKLLDEYRVVHVRGTSSSGKTTLAKLLEARYKEQRQAVIYVNAWHGVNDGTDHFVQLCRQKGYIVDRDSLATSDVVIVFDEAQHSTKIWICGWASLKLKVGPIRDLGCAFSLVTGVPQRDGQNTHGAPPRFISEESKECLWPP